MGGEDAIQIIVRGFGDVGTATAIIDALQDIGFPILSAIDGKGDNYGGTIETHITDTDDLDTDNVGEIRQTIYSLFPDRPDIYLEFKVFYCVHKS